MNSLKTPEQLSQAIEVLVASFIEGSRRAAQEAVQRSFSNSLPSPTKDRRRKCTVAGKPAKRRSAEEVAELCEKLYELICARPGESMGVFAEAVGRSVRALQRPMSKLKAEGRIRSIGERNMTRYFPAVGSRSKSS